jgi:hypothetical protein
MDQALIISRGYAPGERRAVARDGELLRDPAVASSTLLQHQVTWTIATRWQPNLIDHRRRALRSTLGADLAAKVQSPEEEIRRVLGSTLQRRVYQIVKDPLSSDTCAGCVANCDRYGRHIVILAAEFRDAIARANAPSSF